MRRSLSPAVWLFCFVLLAFTAHGFPRDSFPSASSSGRHFISPRFLQIFGRQRPPPSSTKEVAAIPLSPATGPAPVSGKQEPSIQNMLQEVKQEELELKQEVKVLQKEEVDLKAEEREEKLEQERERQEDALENQTQQQQPSQSLSPQVKPPPTPDAVPTPSSSSSEKARPLPAGLVPPVTDALKSQGVVVVKRAPNQPVQNAMLKTTSMTVDGKPLDLQTPCACVGEPKFCDCYDMRTESAAKKHESVCDKEKDKEKCIYQATDLSKLTVRAHLESPVK